VETRINDNFRSDQCRVGIFSNFFHDAAATGPQDDPIRSVMRLLLHQPELALIESSILQPDQDLILDGLWLLVFFNGKWHAVTFEACSFHLLKLFCPLQNSVRIVSCRCADSSLPLSALRAV